VNGKQYKCMSLSESYIKQHTFGNPCSKTIILIAETEVSPALIIKKKQPFERILSQFLLRPETATPPRNSKTYLEVVFSSPS
jgi:hypothetical protein